MSYQIFNIDEAEFSFQRVVFERISSDGGFKAAKDGLSDPCTGL